MVRRIMLALLLPAGLAAQQSACPAARLDAIHVVGFVHQEATWALSDLAAIPRVRVETGIHGAEVHGWEGVSVLELLTRAGVPAGGDLRGPLLRLGVLVEARDGYAALYALAELDDAYTDDPVILADRMDGAAIPADEGPLRIIAPAEKRGARDVRQVTCLRVVRVD